MKQIKLFAVTFLMLVSVSLQAQLRELQGLFQKKVSLDYTFSSSPTQTGKIPKNAKTSFTTAEPVYAIAKFGKTVKEMFKLEGRDGMGIGAVLYAGKKKLGEALTYFTIDQYYKDIQNETAIPLEIIPGENTWQFNSKYVDLLENIAKLEPGIITVKIKRYSSTGGDVIFTLDATNIAQDKARLLRIADRIRNNKKNMYETRAQLERHVWVLPEAAKHDAKLENEIRTLLKANPKAIVTHVVLQSTDWEVRTNQYTGYPESKRMYITYAWKEKGECWIVYTNIFRPHLGGGRYGSVDIAPSKDFHVVDCKNLK